MSPVTEPSNISYGTVKWYALSDIEDYADAGDDPDFIAPTGTVTFRALVDFNRDATNAPDPLTLLRDNIVGVIDDEGYLCTPLADMTPGARDMKLVASDDPDLNPTGTPYSVTYDLRGRSNRKLSLPPHNILVPSDGVVDLSTAGPVAGTPGDATVVGPMGPVGPRGSHWYVGQGTPAVWEAANPGVFDDALPDDQYLDTDTGDIYTLS